MGTATSSHRDDMRIKFVMHMTLHVLDQAYEIKYAVLMGIKILCTPPLTLLVLISGYNVR
jgi:hypothetical protein